MGSEKRRTNSDYEDYASRQAVSSHDLILGVIETAWDVDEDQTKDLDLKEPLLRRARPSAGQQQAPPTIRKTGWPRQPSQEQHEGSSRTQIDERKTSVIFIMIVMASGYI